jgi:hypothetical protein
MRLLPPPGIETHRSRGIEIMETCPSLGRRMATIIVSVRKDVPERLSEPISRKLMVSCPLFRTSLPEASMVARGASVLMRKSGSNVGTSVEVGAGWVEAGEDDSANGWERSVSWAETKGTVGVHGAGWKGVGVGEAFGADVT